MYGSELHRLGRRDAGPGEFARSRALGAREEVAQACGVHDESARSGRRWPLRPEREELVWENRIQM